MDISHHVECQIQPTMANFPPHLCPPINFPALQSFLQALYSQWSIRFPTSRIAFFMIYKPVTSWNSVHRRSISFPLTGITTMWSMLWSHPITNSHPPHFVANQCPHPRWRMILSLPLATISNTPWMSSNSATQHLGVWQSNRTQYKFHSLIYTYIRSII